MWYLVIEALNTPQKRLTLRSGITRIGRASNNDIVIEDSAASRFHACIEYHPEMNTLAITDLQSTNGTFLNRERLAKRIPLKNQDIIRIGQVQMRLENENIVRPAPKNTQRFTRELVLESVDNHSLLLYEVAQKLNTVMDVPAALSETAELIKQFMNVDQCAVILEQDFEALIPQQYDPILANKAIKEKSAEIRAESMYVPIMSDDNLLGLICMMLKRSPTRHFGQRDLQIAVAISHQAALTIQRMRLLELVRTHEQTYRMLSRFVSPRDADQLLRNYSKTGQFPGLREERVTVLFSNIANLNMISEQRGPRELAQILNSFYQNASEIIFKCGGMIKYLGDGILAVFSSETVQNSEERAVDVARELIKRMQPTGPLDDSRSNIIGVAINTGVAAVGYVGVDENVEFTVVGDIVNVTYRLQDYSYPFKIIAGDETIAGLGPDYKHKVAGSVRMTGRQSAIQVHEVVPG